VRHRRDKLVFGAARGLRFSAQRALASATLLRLPERGGVLDGHGRSAREVLGEVQIVRRVAAVRSGVDERNRAERLPTKAKRHDHRRLGLNRRLPKRRRVGMKLGLPCSDDPREGLSGAARRFRERLRAPCSRRVDVHVTFPSSSVAITASPMLRSVVVNQRCVSSSRSSRAARARA
jgi:hypothetical protein